MVAGVVQVSCGCAWLHRSREQIAICPAHGVQAMLEEGIVEEPEFCRRCNEDLTSPRDTRFCTNCGADGCWQCMESSLCDDCARLREDIDAESAWGV